LVSQLCVTLKWVTPVLYGHDLVRQFHIKCDCLNWLLLYTDCSVQLRPPPPSITPTCWRRHTAR
jgi:hypothetical protein